MVPAPVRGDGEKSPKFCIKYQPKPAIWFGHDLKNPFPVWKRVPCSGVVLSAFQFLSLPHLLRRASAEGLRNFLEYRGPFFLDSGGFSFQRQKSCAVSPKDVLEVYRQLRPDIAAVLDHPHDVLNSDQMNRQRWRRTLWNTTWMARRKGDLLLAPVVHALTSQAARYRCQELKTRYPHPPLICIGGLVPLFKQSWIGSRFAAKGNLPVRFLNRWATITAVVSAIGDNFPKTPLHIFGAGSLSTMYLLLLLGVDSLDSVAWRLKAAYGAIQLPGTADRFPVPLTKPSEKKRCGFSDTDAALLRQCSCPSCAGKSFRQRIENLGASFQERATHNAFVFQGEVSLFREARRLGKHLDFVTNRVKALPRYRRALEEVIIPFLVKGQEVREMEWLPR